MSNKIKILDKQTINQIAAGEVVERPASVVKELLENSIDAHSKNIVIELESAGRKLIRVTDDGDGIAYDELKVAFEKHSTSKISTIRDVYNLITFGFRGEALASIAAVSRVECITHDGKSITGSRVVIEGGTVRNISEVGAAKGTTIKIKDLFYNLPARYKYLKSDQTELAHIITVVTHLAIYHHNIGFKLIHNGNELLNFPKIKDQISNLVNIYGKELVRDLIPISMDTFSDSEGKDKNEVTISGYLGKPSITRSDSSYQSIYVNGRYVEAKVISEAIKEVYRTLVMKHRFPFVILFISIEPSSVDVNISPTKMQIRFENEETIYNKILNTLRDILRSHDLIPEVKLTQKPQPVSLKAITTFGVGKPGIFTSIPPIKQQTTSGMVKPGIELSRERCNQTSDQVSFDVHQDKQNLLRSGHESTLPNIHPIGQILDTYVLAQAGDNLLIIDQHAAHERIMYEKIKDRYSSENMSTQELLDPIELELSPREIGLLKTNLDTLKALNFAIDELGNNSFFVKGIPIILGQLQEPEFIHDIINDLISFTKEKKPEMIKDKMIQLMACKAAIKAGKALNMPEIQQLLLELYTINDPYTCAHGRPTIISMTETQLKKLFKRIV